MKWGPEHPLLLHQQQQQEQQQQQQQHYLDPGRLTSALQILTTVTRPRDDSQDSHTNNHDSFIEQQQQQVDSSLPPLGKTIVASDNEVSNGFVKEGRRLPYVFEATESGEQKKIYFFA